MADPRDTDVPPFDDDEGTAGDKNPATRAVPGAGRSFYEESVQRGKSKPSGCLLPAGLGLALMTGLAALGGYYRDDIAAILDGQEPAASTEPAPAAPSAPAEPSWVTSANAMPAKDAGVNPWNTFCTDEAETMGGNQFITVNCSGGLTRTAACGKGLSVASINDSTITVSIGGQTTKEVPKICTTNPEGRFNLTIN